MQTQKNKLTALSNSILPLLFLCCLQFSGLQAQIDIISAFQLNNHTTSEAEAGNLPMPNDAKLYQVSYSGKYYDLKIPTDVSYEYIFLRAVGADGGYKVATSSANHKTWGGGRGATVSASFKIGTGVGEIPPGSTIRFIVGEKGTSVSNGGTSGTGGGGGTGVAYKDASSGKWKVLMVAGGGSGAMGDCCTSGWTGVSGKKYVKGNQGSGAVNGQGENGRGSDVFPHYYKGAISSCAVSTGWKDYPDGEPTGGVTSDDCYNTDGHHRGGWGFGSGGFGVTGASPTMGGGGGYTGGTWGSSAFWVIEEAEGGSSFVNEYEMNIAGIASQENGSTKEPENGNIQFRFIGEPFYLALKADNNKVIARNADPENFAKNADMSLTDRAIINPSTANQLWYYNESTSMIHLTANPDKCMHLPYTNTANGTKISAHDCNTSWGSQKWIIDGDLIRLKGNQDKCLMKKWENHENGNSAVIGDCGNASHDRKEWKIVPYTPPTFITLNADTEKALQKDGSTNYLEVGNRGSGSSTNTEYQLWYYDENTSMIRLASQPEKCINLPYADAENGKKIALQDCNPNWASQRWTLSGQEIHLKSNPDKCLVKRWDANSVDNPIVIWDCGNSSHTRKDWKLLPQYSN